MKRPSHIPNHYLELSLLVVKEFSGWRADRFVAHRIPRLSRNRVQKILKSLAFDHSGKPVKPNRQLRTGEIIYLYKEPPDEPEVCRDFSVVYEDEWLLAVDKPARLPVHPTARYLKNTLTHLLSGRYDSHRPRLCHRLDAETSGIVLCAKTPEAERTTKGLFARRQVRKTYYAIVDGVPEPAQGRIEVPISPDPNSEVKARMWCGDPSGLPSLTEYKTLQNNARHTLLELHPRTGRQHQLRVHLAHLGWPIIGDKLYGPDRQLFLDYMADGLTDDIIARAGHPRQALHAHRLELTHPFTNRPLTILAPLPTDLVDLI